MTHPIYTRTELVNLSISELRAICTSLSIPRRRSKEDCISDILAAQPQVVAQAELGIVEEETDDYLFHNEQPANLPQVNDTHLIGNFLLRCIEVGSVDYVTVWNVSTDGKIDGEIKMDWHCFWHNSTSLATFATPQEAVIDLYDSLQKLLKEQQQQEEEPITFEKVALDRWEETVNGVRVTITAFLSGYKTNITDDAVFDDFAVAIKQSLVAVARIQEKRLLERTERAAVIQVLKQQGDEFVVQNSENGSCYTVQPNHLDLWQRCECPDCHHRGSKCKHQIAVENFLGQRLKDVVVRGPVSLDDLQDLSALAPDLDLAA